VVDRSEVYVQESLSYSDDAGKYILCMKEISSRLKLIQKYWAKPPPIIPDQQSIEFICLQFRFIFELIMLSSLVANKKAYNKAESSLKSLYNPTLIKKELEKFNSKFYPVAMSFIDARKAVNVENGYMTKDELIKAYLTTSNFLHARNPYSKERDFKMVYNQFEKWAGGINKLLLRHSIKLKGEDRYFIVGVDFDDKNTVTVIYARPKD
jgi:hypothetical protein